MPIVKFHSYNIIADFMNSYESIIRPFLEHGDIETASPAIWDVYDRRKLIRKEECSPSAFVRYIGAVISLNNLVEHQERHTPEILDFLTARIERDANELDMLLNKNKEYSAHREDFK
jgi:hypothetical protein